MLVFSVSSFTVWPNGLHKWTWNTELANQSLRIMGRTFVNFRRNKPVLGGSVSWLVEELTNTECALCLNFGLNGVAWQTDSEIQCCPPIAFRTAFKKWSFTQCSVSATSVIKAPLTKRSGGSDKVVNNAAFQPDVVGSNPFGAGQLTHMVFLCQPRQCPWKSRPTSQH